VRLRFCGCVSDHSLASRQMPAEGRQQDLHSCKAPITAPTMTKIGCHDCGLVQLAPALAPGIVASCRRCDAMLSQPRLLPFKLGLALTVTTAVLSLPALLDPIFVVHFYGRYREDLVSTGVSALWTSHIWPLALMVGALAIVIPVLWIGSLAMVFACLHAGRTPSWLGIWYRWSRTLDGWVMPDVFMVGAIVAYTKIRSMVMVEVAAGGWCFIGFALAVMALRAFVDPQQIWAAIGPSDGATSDLRNSVTCHHCTLVLDPSAIGIPCPRCGGRVETRKIHAYQRALALVIAAYLLYIPANLLPVLSLVQFGRTQAKTILEGARELYETGMWPLALIVLIASIAVPIMKLLGLTWFLISTRQKSSDRLIARTRTYRIIDLIGRWSNVDVFVISISAALLQFDRLTMVRAELGAVAFGAVVLLTMVASRMFDPRIMWDAAAKANG
jgi:paraquat-inducible protein A